MNLSKLSLVAAIPLVLAGCVSKGKYDAAVAVTETTRAELKRKDAVLASTSAELTERQADIARLKEAMGRLEALTQTSTGEVASTRTRLGELQKRLTELEAAQRATEARAALYKDVSQRLKKQIDDGNLALVVRDGRMVLQLPNDVLFDTGRTEIKPAGKEALKAVAEVIRSLPNRHFQIAGHTDNVPIRNDRFPSNWELSTGRALGVLHFLVREGAQADALSAAGYSDVDPVADNRSPDGRKMNRRTEITLQPNIDELVKVP